MPAIAMMGTWNYGQGVAGGGSFTPSASSFTFARRRTAIAKCVELHLRLPRHRHRQVRRARRQTVA
ncbi:MAG TPA: hypothetical protein VFS43_13455 [Polyangiaceae bacterium]|nr:hypothetical protein [Polyangiaceae bacterium]